MVAGCMAALATPPKTDGCSLEKVSNRFSRGRTCPLSHKTAQTGDHLHPPAAPASKRLYDKGDEGDAGRGALLVVRYQLPVLSCPESMTLVKRSL